MIFADPPVKTVADYAVLSDSELWRQWAIEGNRQEAAEDDDEEHAAATASLNAIRLVMEERNLIHTTVRRF
jgi:hypothetical protein